MNTRDKKKKEKRNIVLRYIIYIVLLFSGYIFMTSVSFIKNMPLIMFAIAICIAFFEEPFSAAVIGSFAGALTDMAEGTLIGINAIIILWCCLMISLLFRFIMRKHIINIIVVAFASIFLQTGFKYIFNYFIWNYDDGGKIYFSEILPVIILTLICTVIFYPVIKIIYKKFGKITLVYIEEKSDDIVRE